MVPAYAQEEYVQVLTMGAKKYGDNNWRKGMKWSNILSSLERHLAAIKKGEDRDLESGFLHTAHIMCNAAFLSEYVISYPSGDDRIYKKPGPLITLDEDKQLSPTRTFLSDIPKTALQILESLAWMAALFGGAYMISRAK